MRALAMSPSKDNVRRSRWVVVRNTLPQLETTTMATWKDWFGEQVFKDAPITGRSPYKQTITHPLQDGTSLELQMIFMALDSVLDIGKLMSLECTGIWFNELRYIEPEVYREAQTRPGRYPRKQEIPKENWIDEETPYWSGIIADTNPPDVGGWIYKMCEEIKPENLDVFHQPSGLSEHAENLEHLKADYYTNMAIGKPKEWVNVYVHGKYGYFHDGASVYEGVWNDDVHFARKKIGTIKGRQLVGGIDASGRSPAAVVMQQDAMGQWQVLWEFCAEDVGAVSYAPLLRAQINQVFPNAQIVWWGDPAGQMKSGHDERTYFDILRAAGITVLPSPGFYVRERIETVAGVLSRMIGGRPALVVSEAAPKLRQGFNGGYRYRKTGKGDDAITLPEPDKGKYSHVHDALQYALCGAGEMLAVKGRQGNQKTIDYDTNW